MWAAAWELKNGFRARWFVILSAASSMVILAGFPAITATAVVSTLLYAGMFLAVREMRPAQIGMIGCALALEARVCRQ
jgi:hypothetical protein